MGFLGSLCAMIYCDIVILRLNSESVHNIYSHVYLNKLVVAVVVVPYMCTHTWTIKLF